MIHETVAAEQATYALAEDLAGQAVHRRSTYRGRTVVPHHCHGPSVFWCSFSIKVFIHPDRQVLFQTGYRSIKTDRSASLTEKFSDRASITCKNVDRKKCCLVTKSRPRLSPTSREHLSFPIEPSL